MAFNFSQPKPTGTAKYTFDTLPAPYNEAKLEVRYAGKGNPGFRSAELKKLDAIVARGGVGKITESKIESDNREMAELLATHVIVGWTGVVEHDGSPSPATPAKFLEFLMQLIAGNFELEFSNFVAFCREQGNFRDAPPSAGVELGKA